MEKVTVYFFIGKNVRNEPFVQAHLDEVKILKMWNSEGLNKESRTKIKSVEVEVE